MTYDPILAKRERSLPEIHEMIRLRLFTDPEVKEILDTRQKFELELTRNANLHSYKKYIEFENNLFKTVQKRRKRLHIIEKKSDIDYKILKSIRNLYELAVKKYADDRALCMSYLNFARQKNIPGAANNAILLLMRRHAGHPKVWIAVAKYYAYDRKDINLALQTLEKGRTFHEDNGLIYKEAISLEITKALGKETVVKEEDDELDQRKAVCVEKILLYIDEMFTNVKDCNSYIDLLKYLEDHPFTMEIQKRIVNFLLMEYKGEPLVWQMIAQREWKGLHMKPQPSNSLKTRLTLSVAKYREGMGAIEDNEKEEELFQHYFDFLIKQEDSKTMQLKKKFLKKACEDASEEGLLEEHHYVQWFELAKDDDKELVLERANTFLPESLIMWKLRLHHMFLKTKDMDSIDEFLRLCISNLQEEALPLWLAMIEFKSLHTSKQEVESLFFEAMEGPQPVSSYILPEYLGWIFGQEGIEKTRIVYNEKVLAKPYNKHLHTTMAMLESYQIKPNVHEWEKPLKNACDQFGDEDEDVWISYIDFLRSSFKRSMNIPKEMETIKELIEKAKCRLPPSLQTNFQNKLKKLNLQFCL